MNRNRTDRAFTLLELIVVMAITALLLTIITFPVVHSFNLTRSAQSFADAQNRARVLIDQLTREIGNSAGVRDNSGRRGSQYVSIPSDPNGDGNIDGYADVLLSNVKLDIMAPASGDPLRGPTGALLNPNLLKDPNANANDPTNWKEDPTLRTPIGQPVLPAAGGFRMVRYFIGLRRPFTTGANGRAIPYINPYDRLLTRNASGEDNLYVLYRADIELRRWNSARQAWELNTEVFQDLNNDGVADDIDDPAFFTLRSGADFDAAANFALTTAGQTKASRMQAWLRRSRIVTEISRYDMIQPVYNKNGRQVTYDGTVPRIYPLIQFTPTRVSSEPAEGMVAVRSGEETPNSEKVGPDVFRTNFGGWTSARVRTWPSIFNSVAPWATFAAWQSSTPYLMGRPRNGTEGTLSVFAFNGAGNELTEGEELFDIEAYRAAKSADEATMPRVSPLRYPFSYAVNEANTRSGWLANADLRALFVPYTVDERLGRVVASFGIDEVGDGNRPPGGPDNRPVALVGTALTPNADPNTQGAPNATRWTQDLFRPNSPTSTVNGRFNALWTDWPVLAPNFNRADYVKRFIDLRVTPQSDGSPSPLHPSAGFARARIVPGSEVVVGPDQMPGPNYGRATRYTRVPKPPVGPNQYYINYVNQREPDWNGLGISGVSTDPRDYNASDFVSAVLQPRFRAGYLELNSRFGEPIPDQDMNGAPAGNILVTYRFQFTEPNDVFAIDYDSRQVLDVNLTIRNYPQTGEPSPQTITVKGSATVRNFIR